MDQENCQLAASLVSRTYISQGAQALQHRRKLVKALLSQRRLPPEGWDDATIELFIQDVALMDSNNFPSNVGVGEREARVASELVARRHWRLAHGIGRSGDVSAEQPKAAGSSLLVKLTNLLAANALEIAGLKEVGPVLVLPAATGMAITTTLLALRSMRPATARYVLWPRVDQKTCLKSITAAGFEVVPIPMLRQPGADELTTDLAAIQHQLEMLGPDQVACIVTTTSCFAPRAADDVVAVAKLCQAVGVPHIINNAYGVQASTLCAAVTSAWRKGRVDAVIQSTDKNFMVPVGGAIVAARRGHTQLVEQVNSLYPGRASMSPLLDLLITLLHWGASGWRQVLEQREELYGYALERLQAFAAEVGERVLSTPGNPISLALTLDSLTSSVGGVGRSQQGQPAANGATAAATGSLHHAPQELPTPRDAETSDCEGRTSRSAREGSSAHTVGGCIGALQPGNAIKQQPLEQDGEDQQGSQHAAAAVEAAGPGGTAGAGAAAPALPVLALPATLLGSMLFKRCVSGTRVVSRGKRQTVGGVTFEGYGAHADDYPHDYLTVAAAVGTTHAEIDGFVERARQCFAEFKRRQHHQQQQ